MEEYNNFSIVNMVLKLSMPLPSPDYFRLQDVNGLTRADQRLTLSVPDHADVSSSMHMKR